MSSCTTYKAPKRGVCNSVFTKVFRKTQPNEVDMPRGNAMMQVDAILA